MALLRPRALAKIQVSRGDPAGKCGPSGSEALKNLVRKLEA